MWNVCPGFFVCVAEVQCRQASLVQLQEEVECQRAQLKQMEFDKDSQLISLKEELLSQLDSCQARVSTFTLSQNPLHNIQALICLVQIWAKSFLSIFLVIIHLHCFIAFGWNWAENIAVNFTICPADFISSHFISRQGHFKHMWFGVPLLKVLCIYIDGGVSWLQTGFCGPDRMLPWIL